MSKPRPMTDDEKRKYNIPLKAQGTFLTLGDGIVETKTAGWTDDQIRAKSIKELDAMIESGEKALDSLRKTLRAEEDRINDLRRVRQRKTDIGG